MHEELKLKPLNISSLIVNIYSALRLELYENLEKVDLNYLNLNEKDQVNVLLYRYQINQPKSFSQSILNNDISYWVR